MRVKYLSKEEAKRLIDLSPSEQICVTIINEDKDCSRQVQPVRKEAGHLLIDKSSQRTYSDQDFFGQLFLRGVIAKSYIHGLTFAQGKFQERTDISENGKK